MVYGSTNVQALPHTLQSAMFKIIQMLPTVCSLLLRVITNRHFVVYFSSLFIPGSMLQHLLLSMMLVFKLPKIELCYEHGEAGYLLGGEGVGGILIALHMSESHSGIFSSDKLLLYY